MPVVAGAGILTSAIIAPACVSAVTDEPCAALLAFWLPETARKDEQKNCAVTAGLRDAPGAWQGHGCPEDTVQNPGDGADAAATKLT